jgi:ferredoxin-NADP reductase
MLRTKLLSRREVAERTMAFEFEKPPGFEFAAGQALEVKLVDPPETDAEGDGRAFSIASAPSAERLEIATRLRDTAFKRVLSAMPIGGAVELDGPFGSLTLHKAAEKPAVIVAGGIGITPFMSILRQAEAERSSRAFVLATANRRPEDAPYSDELARFAKALPGFRFLPLMSQAEKSARVWNGARGRLTPDWLARSIPELKSAVCYTAGPPAMVAAARAALVAAGADEDSIRTEDFAGY